MSFMNTAPERNMDFNLKTSGFTVLIKLLNLHLWSDDSSNETEN